MEERMEPRIKFREELDALMQKLIGMGVLVEEAVSKALFALEQRNTDIADEVIERDAEIDQIQQDIEDNCIRIIATEQPVAHDLREIITTVKVVDHIERIGDHASYLAKAVKEIPEEIMEPALPKIKKMAEIGIAMLKQSIDAFVQRDAEKAQKAADQDVTIDNLHKELYSDILEMMEKNPRAVEYGSTLLFLNRFMERLGDHVINICDWVCYANTGERLTRNKKNL
jgi:phosphate transport system protein